MDIFVSYASQDRSRVEPLSEPDKKITNDLDMEFVYIAPGTFTMGSPEDEPGHRGDETQHQVTLTKGYYLQTTEVTQRQWQTVTDYNPSRFKNCNECPVEQISWNNAQAFIKQFNSKDARNTYRLPTEAEWEYACRAGSVGAYGFGDDDEKLVDHAWYQSNSGGETHPVSSLKPNAWGLYDMHGNVWEWCAENPKEEVTDPTGPSSVVDRVLRGGSWGIPAAVCRSAVRYGNLPSSRVGSFGFRLVRLPGQ